MEIDKIISGDQLKSFSKNVLFINWLCFESKQKPFDVQYLDSLIHYFFSRIFSIFYFFIAGE